MPKYTLSEECPEAPVIFLAGDRPVAVLLDKAHGPLLALAGEMTEAILEYDGRPDRDPKIEALMIRLRPLVARAEGREGNPQG